jgi:exopolysaccharide production protein ExoY
VVERLDEDDKAAPSPAGPGLARPARSRAKRAIDVAVVLAVTPLALPLGLLLGLLVRLTSRGPALFRQERVGLHGESFCLLKFRTMVADAEERLALDPDLWALYVANDYKVPLQCDPRVTPVGRLLRRTSLDELPQLVNVFNGTMSLVGPRPVIRAEYDAFADAVGAYKTVRPGLTGHWQVNAAHVRYPERADYDRRYVEDWSLWRDLSILARTPVTVVLGRAL